MMSAHNRTDGDPKWGLVGSVAAAVGASACCLGPLLLLALGIGGAWIGYLTAMEKYRPYWIAATLIFLGLAFFRAYRKPRKGACATGSACKQNAERRNKTLVWVVAVFIFALLALPYFIPFAFGGGPEDGAVPRQITLSVRNMTCSACVVTVKKSLTRVDGVKDVKVTLDPPRAAVLYDPTKIGAERLMEATTKAGFPSAVIPEGGR
jgi:mercuric ion transport protein